MKAKILTILILSSIGVYAFVRYQDHKTNQNNQAKAFIAMPDDVDANYQTSIQASGPFDYSSLACEEVLRIVTQNGVLRQELQDYEMQSSALQYVSLWEYSGINFVVLRFQKGKRDYIYCNIDQGIWNSFVENAHGSYGKSYHKYLRPKTRCNCGK